MLNSIEAGSALGFRNLEPLWPPMWPPSPLAPRKLAEWVQQRSRERQGDVVELSQDALRQREHVYEVGGAGRTEQTSPSNLTLSDGASTTESQDASETTPDTWVQQRINLVQWQQAVASE